MVSICVPTYEMKGRGVEFLSQLLDSLTNQTNQAFEVVISDDSTNCDIEMFVRNSNYPFAIQYYKNSSEKKSASININNAIRHAKYDIIKPLFQDDWVVNDRMVELLSSAQKPWGAFGWRQSDREGEQYPYWHYLLPIGKNTIGCPSGVFFRKHPAILFDENLIQLMDTDLYYTLRKTYGQPQFISEVCYISRVWDGSVSKTQVDLKLHLSELRYLQFKYRRADLVSKYWILIIYTRLRKKLVEIKRAIVG